MSKEFMNTVNEVRNTKDSSLVSVVKKSMEFTSSKSEREIELEIVDLCRKIINSHDKGQHNNELRNELYIFLSLDLLDYICGELVFDNEYDILSAIENIKRK